MKPVLISKHEDEAQGFIQGIENDYLPLVETIISHVRGLGLTPTEMNIRAVLVDGPEILRGQYLAYAERDVSPSASSAARGRMRNFHQNIFTEFLQKVNPLFETTIGGRSFKDPMFQDLIIFNKALKPLLSEEGREKIREQFREYVSDPKILKVHNAIQDAAKGLQAFWQAMVRAGYASELHIDYSKSGSPGWMFERQVLNILTSFLTITGTDGRYQIEPRQLNFITAELKRTNDHE